MRAPRRRQRLGHRAAAGARADDDDVVAGAPSRRAAAGPATRPGRRRSGPSAAGPRWRARGSSPAPGPSRDRRREVAIHRPVAADVAEARELQRAAAPRPRASTNRPLDSNVMTPAPAEELRQPQAAEERRHLARVVERADGAVVVARTPPSCSWRGGRARRATPPAGSPGAETMRGPRLPAMCSQWMPSSKKASPPAMASSLRQSSAAFRRWAMVVKCGEHHLADVPRRATSRRRCTASGL